MHGRPLNNSEVAGQPALNGGGNMLCLPLCVPELILNSWHSCPPRPHLYQSRKCSSRRPTCGRSNARDPKLILRSSPGRSRRVSRLVWTVATLPWPIIWRGGIVFGRMLDEARLEYMLRCSWGCSVGLGMAQPLRSTTAELIRVKGHKFADAQWRLSGHPLYAVRHAVVSARPM
jgi:hypothetical protein